MLRVSVIMAVFNCAPYIRQAIESVLSQTYRDCELILVDGGSTDGTLDLITPYLGRVRLLGQSGRGVSNARNEGIKVAGGELIAILDGDDYWLPEKLAAQVEYLGRHPEAGMVFSDLYALEPDGRMFGPAFKKTGIYPSEGYVFEQLLEGTFNVSTITTVTRRECLEHLKGFDENIFFAEDTDLWLRLTKLYPVGFIPQPLAVYRYVPSSRSFEFEKHYLSKIGILHRVMKETPGVFGGDVNRQRLVIGKQYYKLGYRFFAVNDAPKAREYFRAASSFGFITPRLISYYAASRFPPPILKLGRMLKRRLAATCRGHSRDE